MTSLYEPPTSHIIAGGLMLIGMYAAARSARLIVGGLRDARPLDLVRGIRLSVLALVAELCAIGFLSAQTGFVTLAAIILAEELYETGLLAAVIRLGERGTAERLTPP
ncbi:MAG TPA: hypothetical protein VGT40_07995 [Methylomirabilota bacterium]|jgi:hypothetical protein|nr:hypothetical protein [Methylomirabilota bacterium]